MLKLIYFMKDYKKEAILGPIFKLIEAILELFIPIVMAKIIDVGVANRDINYVLKMGGLLILLGAIGLGFALVCQYYASIASQGAGTSIRSELYKHINNLSHTEIDKIGTPTLMTRLINDINQIQTGIAMLIRLGTRSPFVIIGSTIMAFMLDFKLSIIFLITTPLIALVIYLVMSKSLPLYKVIQGKLDNLSLITRENLEGVRVIKAFSKEETEKERFKNATIELTEANIKVGKISALLNPITYIIMNSSVIAILWFGGIRVNIGSLSQGEVIAFVNYITQILLSLIVFSQLIVILTKGATSANRVLEILNIESSIKDNENTIFNKGNLSKTIELSRYISEENIQLNLVADNWEEAIRLSAIPLLKSNDITEEYIDAMIDNVKNLGPYIVVDEGIAIPHARPDSYVKNFGMTINTFKKPITIGSHNNIRIFITIASVNNENHIELITQIMKLIEDESFIDILNKDNISEKEVLNLIRK